MKTNLIIILPLITLLCLQGCQENDTPINEKNEIGSNDSLKTVNDKISVSLHYPKPGKVFTYQVKLNSIENYSLTIETTLIYDSVFLTNDYYSGGNKVVLNQSLVFKHGDTIINKKNFSVKNAENIEKKIKNKKNLLPQYVVTSYLYKESNCQTLYVLYAFGLNNGSNEISAYYNNEGELMGTTNCNRTECDTIGNLTEVECKYSVCDSTCLSEVCIFPPQFAGRAD